MKNTLYLTLLVALVMQSCTTAVDIRFDEQFGSEITIEASGPYVDAQFEGVADDYKEIDLPELHGLSSGAQVARTKSGARFSSRFVSIDDLNKSMMRADGIADEEMSDELNFVQWQNDRIMMFMMPVSSQSDKSGSGLMQFINAPTDMAVEHSALQVRIDFPYDIKSAECIPPGEITADGKGILIETDFSNVRDNDDLIMGVISFAKKVRPKS